MSRSEFPRLQIVILTVLRSSLCARVAGAPSKGSLSSPISLKMSLSPSTSNDTYDQPTGKRRRTSFSINTSYNNSGNGQMMPSPQDQTSNQQLLTPTPQAHIPKRGARACTACRKGKNRCEGEVRLLPRARFPSSRCLSLARILRPARLIDLLAGSMSTMSTKWHTLRL